MQHGLTSSSDAWIANSEDKAPAFVFAKIGYDVWLGNNRGNLWSRRHETLDPDSAKDKKQFFTYTFEDLGTYDLPAQVDKVKEVTGVDKVTYIGHSQGGSQIFYALATNLEQIKERLNMVIGFAPIIRIGNTCDATFKAGVSYRRATEKLFDLLGFYEIMGKHWKDTKIKFCSVLRPVCEYIDRWNYHDSKYNSDERGLISSSKGPSAAGWRELLHYSQEIGSKRFEHYDLGPDENMKKYGQDTPPEIDVT